MEYNHVAYSSYSSFNKLIVDTIKCFLNFYHGLFQHPSHHDIQIVLQTVIKTKTMKQTIFLNVTARA